MHRNTWILCAITFANAASITLPGLFGPRLFACLGVRDVAAWSSAYLSAVMLFQVGAHPMWHAASRGLGLSPAIAAGQALLGVSLLAAAATDSPALLLALRCTQGLSNGNLSLTRIALNREGRPADVPFLVTALLAGVLAGSLLGAYLYDDAAGALPHAAPCAAAAAMQLISAMALRWREAEAGEAEGAAIASSSPTSSHSYAAVLARHPRAYATQVAAQCFLYGTDMVLSLAMRGLAPSPANRHMAVSNACALAAAIGTTRADRPDAPLVASALLYASFGALVHASGLGEGVAATAVVALRGIAYGALVVATSVLVNRAVHREPYMAEGLALFQTLTSAVATAAPLGAGAAWSAALYAVQKESGANNPFDAAARLAFGGEAAAALAFAAALGCGWHRDAALSMM